MAPIMSSLFYPSSTSLRDKGKDINHYQQLLLRFLFSPESERGVTSLNIPLARFGCTSVTEFITKIPKEVYQPFKNAGEPQSVIHKNYKVFWERNALAEPATFRWQGTIEGQHCVGLQLDRKRCVPFETHDGRGLFSCKPGHRALVPAYEVIPYKEFLRSFLGGTPTFDDTVVETKPSQPQPTVTTADERPHVKQFKKGDRVFLQSEERWATIQWTGRIGNKRVVDIIYDESTSDGIQNVRSMQAEDFLIALTEPPTDIRRLEGSPKQPGKTQEIKPDKEKSRRVESDEDSETDTESDYDSTSEDSDSSHHYEPEKTTTTKDQKPSLTKNEQNSASYPGMEDKKKPKPFVSLSRNKNISRSFQAKDKIGDNSTERPSTLKRVENQPVFKPEEVKLSVKEVVASSTEQPQKPIEDSVQKLKEIKPVTEEGEGTKKSEEKNYAKITPEPKPRGSVRGLQSMTEEPVEKPERQAGRKQLMSDSLLKFRANSPVEKKSTKPQKGVKGSGFSFSLSSLLPAKKGVKGKVVQKKQQQNRRPSPPDYEKIAYNIVENEEKQKRQQAAEEKERAMSAEPYSKPKPEYSPEATPVFFEKKIQHEPKKKSPSPPPRKEPEGNSELDSDELSSSDSEIYTPASIRSAPAYTNNQSNEKTTPQAKKRVFKRQNSFGKSIALATAFAFGNLQTNKNKSPSKNEPSQEQSQKHESEAPKPAVAMEHQDDEIIYKQPRPQPDDELQRNGQTPDDGIVLDYLEVDENQPDLNSPPPIPEKKKRRISTSSTGSKVLTLLNFPTYTKQPKKSTSDTSLKTPPEKIILTPQTPPATASPEVKEDSEKFSRRNKSPFSSFRSSFSRKLSIRKKQQKNAPVVDIKSWNERRGKSEDDPFEEPSTPKTPISPKTPPALLPKRSFDEEGIPKHRMFTTPGIFRGSKSSLSADDKVVKVPKPSKYDLLFSTATSNAGNAVRTTQSHVNPAVSASATKENGIISPTAKQILDLPDPPNIPDDEEYYYDSFTDDEDYIEENEPEPQSPQKSNEKYEEQEKILQLEEEPKSPKQNMAAFTPGPKRESSFRKLVPQTIKSMWSSDKNKGETPVKKDISEAENKLRKSSSGSADKTSVEMIDVKKSPKQVRISQDITPPSFSECVEALHEPPYNLTASGLPKRGGSDRRLKSALKQRQQIEEIPNGIKIKDRVLWYNGNDSIPGSVLKLYRDGADKYTAIVKFDQENFKKPVSLVREGDGYLITVEELMASEVFETSAPPTQNGISSSPISQTEVKPSSPIRFRPSVTTNGDIGESSSSQPDLPPPFMEHEVKLACGVHRGIPCDDRCGCLENILFALYFTTNTFDISTLYENQYDDDDLTKKLKYILREHIVKPLRETGACEKSAVDDLKELVDTFTSNLGSLKAEAEIMITILMEKGLKLGNFILYSDDSSDYMHQLEIKSSDLSRSATVQSMLEMSLEMRDNLTLKTIPTPGLILEIPRERNKLLHYEAVIPNLSLNLAPLIQNGPKVCLCGQVAKYECFNCVKKVGGKALVFCDNCRSLANQIHFQLDHEIELINFEQGGATLDLVALICKRGEQYFTFAKCSTERLGPWLFYDAMEPGSSKVSVEQNLGMWLDRLERYPGKYTEAIPHPLLACVLLDPHICIYQPREKSSLV